jgi:hypothetical protein
MGRRGGGSCNRNNKQNLINQQLPTSLFMLALKMMCLPL